MIRLIIVRGLPGSGKSTYAASRKGRWGKHFETDQFFMVDGEYRFDPKRLREAHAWCLESVQRCIEGSGKPDSLVERVVVSNTFTQLWEMQPYLDLVARDVQVEVVKVVGKFKSVHSVPEESIQRMRDRWEDFSTEYVYRAES